MFYRIRNWERYQNADILKKSGSGVLPWIKLWTKEDYELAKQPYYVRLLFVEMLKLAGREMNAIPADLGWLSTQVSMAPEDVSQGLTILLKMAWLSETKTDRRSRVQSRKLSRANSRTEKKKKREEIRGRAERWVASAGWQFEDVDMLDFIHKELHVTDPDDLKALLVAGQRIRRARQLQVSAGDDLDPLAPVIEIERGAA